MIKTIAIFICTLFIFLLLIPSRSNLENQYGGYAWFSFESETGDIHISLVPHQMNWFQVRLIGWNYNYPNILGGEEREALNLIYQPSEQSEYEKILSIAEEARHITFEVQGKQEIDSIEGIYGLVIYNLKVWDN